MKLKLEKITDVKTLIDVTRQFKSDIDLVTGRYRVDAKSIMGIYSMDFSKDMDVEFIAKENETAEDFKQALQNAGLNVA